MLNFLRQLKNVDFTFELQKLTSTGKGDFSSLKNCHLFQKKKPRAEDTFELCN